ncbi:MAG: hypothetical protein AAF503_05055 [Pseudomonadota bacterium]
MRRPGWIALIGGALVAMVLALDGTRPLSRVALGLGLSDLAAALTDDPGLRGEALFRAGRYAAAAGAFAEAGQAYNQGLAAAWAGDYATALVAWDRVLAANPRDQETRANHKIVASLLAGMTFDPVPRFKRRDREGETVEADIGKGKGRAEGEGDATNNPKSGFWMPEVAASGLRRVPNIFDEQFVAADRRWLATLEDQPGIYLRARLAAEQKRRDAAGTALPMAEDPQ